jgi:sporulation protein YlmC with PRC-barrel domain
MIRVVHCDSCGRKVGTREDLTLNIKKGCQVEIIITCANCLRPKPRPKPWTDEDAMNFFKGGLGE